MLLQKNEAKNINTIQTDIKPIDKKSLLDELSNQLIQIAGFIKKIEAAQ